MMKIIKDIRFAFVLYAGLLFLASPSVLEGKEAAVSNSVQDSGRIDKNIIDRETPGQQAI
jgi:hypothetical protein